MKRTNKLILLVCILAVCCAVTVIVLHTEEKKELIRTSDEMILEIDPKSVDSLAWEYEGEEGAVSLSFSKQDGHWVYDKDNAFPVDDEKLEQVLSVFEKLGASFVIDEVEDFSLYGLKQPECKISFSADGQDYSVKLGAFSTMDAQRYVSLDNGSVYLVTEDPMDYFRVLLEDLVKFDEMPAFDHVTEIRFSGEQNYRIVRVEGSDESCCVNDVYYAELDGQRLPLDTEAVEKYLRAISSIRFTKYKSYNMSEDEKVAFGQDKPQLTVEVDYADKADGGELGEAQTFRMVMGRDLDEQTRRDAAAAANEPLANLIVTAYVRVNDSNVVYSVSDEKCTALLANGYDDLRHRQAMPADFNATVESFEATLDGETFAFTSTLPEKGDRVFSCDAGEFVVTTLRVRIQNIAVTEFSDDVPQGYEEISMVFRLNAPNFPEMRFAAYRVDAEKCLVTVNGEPFGYTERQNVVDLREAVLTAAYGGYKAEED